jgi:hypothetical protein
MQDAIEALGKCVGDALGVEQVGDEQARLGCDRFAMAALEIVEHGDLVPGRDEQLGADRPDIPGAARDEQLHASSSRVGTWAHEVIQT